MFVKGNIIFVRVYVGEINYLVIYSFLFLYYKIKEKNRE